MKTTTALSLRTGPHCAAKEWAHAVEKVGKGRLTRGPTQQEASARAEDGPEGGFHRPSGVSLFFFFFLLLLFSPFLDLDFKFESIFAGSSNSG
jgi:hypothetical protein